MTFIVFMFSLFGKWDAEKAHLNDTLKFISQFIPQEKKIFFYWYDNCSEPLLKHYCVSIIFNWTFCLKSDHYDQKGKLQDDGKF